MRRPSLLFRTLLFLLCSQGGLFADAELFHVHGTHQKESPVYAPGEKMVFTIKLMAGEKPVAGATLKWKRTGGDGLVKDGESVFSKQGCQITASRDKPGFVRIYGTVWQDGKELKSAGKAGLMFIR